MIGQSDNFGDVLSRSPGALSFRMEKPVVPVGQQMEQSFPLESFRKKGITSDVFLFSRFYRNDRNITEPFASSYLRTMLLGEIRGLFPKNFLMERTISFDSPTELLAFP